MREKKLWSRLALVWCSGLLVACSTLVSPVGRHPTASDDFTKSLRWRDFSGAAQHMTETLQGDFLERFAGNDDLQIVDFTLERVEFRDDDRMATAWYTMEYNLLPSSSVKKERIRLEWAYQGEGDLHPGVWVITSEFPPLP